MNLNDVSISSEFEYNHDHHKHKSQLSRDVMTDSSVQKQSTKTACNITVRMVYARR